MGNRLEPNGLAIGFEPTGHVMGTSQAGRKIRSTMRAIEAGDVAVSRVSGTQETYVVGHIAEDISASGLVLTDPELTIGRDAAINRGFERRREDRKVWLFDGPEWFDVAYVDAQPAQVADLDLRSSPHT